ncbi:MAG: Mrp/NBP35 family ATP-binding protein [Acidobacteria bacterium]|nr:Mrp/NBP35 family ATP-binding protein [Acidobacteriota bacterium]
MSPDFLGGVLLQSPSSLISDVEVPTTQRTLRQLDAIVGDEKSIKLRLPVLDPSVRGQVLNTCRELLKSAHPKVALTQEFSAQRVLVADRKPVPGVRNLIAVASGKGGVGKSTLSANLAVALAQLGARVGLLDADVYGPNVAVMFGATDPPRVNDRQLMVPITAHGIQIMSMGMLIPQGQPLIWRGPMTHKVVQQFLYQIAWDDLDYLIVDLPPGTGDVQLSLTQEAPLSASVLVTTPQKVATADARKGYEMFSEVGVPTLGLVENMSGFICPNCNDVHEIFGMGGGQRMANELGVTFLGRIPLDHSIPSDLGEGKPIVVRNPDGPIAEAISDIALNVAQALMNLAFERQQSGHFFPMEV